MRTLYVIAGRLLRAAAATTVLAGMVAGIPWFLVAVMGWPLPDHWPSLAEAGGWLTQGYDIEFVLNVLTVGCWIFWARFAVIVAVELVLAVYEAVRYGRRRVSARSGLHAMAAVLVAAIVGTLLLDLARGLTAPSGPGPAHPHPVATTGEGELVGLTARRINGSGVAVALAARTETHTPTTHGPRPATVPVALASTGKEPPWVEAARAEGHDIYPVCANDNLWNIARDRLGDPQRWREIYVLNRDKPQANGFALTDPDQIHTGWLLVLPVTANAAPASPSPATDREPEPAGSTASAPPTAATAAPSAPAPSTSSSSTPAPSTSSSSTPPSPPASASPTPSSATAPVSGTAAAEPAQPHATGKREGGVVLPSQAWVSLGLAAVIAAVASVLRLHRRRRVRLDHPIPLRTGPMPSPVPASLKAADAAGSRVLDKAEANPPPVIPVPIGVTADGDEFGLLDLPGPGVALTGDGAVPAARAILAAALSTGHTEHPAAQPVVVTTADTLSRLLSSGAAPAGVDPRRNGERLIVVESTAKAVSTVEEEMIHRRRILDALDEATVVEANVRHDHAEHLPAFILLVEADDRFAPRVAAVAQHRAVLHLHPVLLGESSGIPRYEVADGGTLAEPAVQSGGRLSTLAATDLADVLALIREAAPRPQADFEDNDPALPTAAPVEVSEIPAPTPGTTAPVQLTVLGPIVIATETGPIRSGVRRGSLAVLAMLAAHPSGRTLEQIATDLHPDAGPDAALNRVHTDIVAARTLLRQATGVVGKGRFIVRDTAHGGRYRLDPDLIEVDLWRMLAAIDRANKAGDDEAALAALREAADCYDGDFATGEDRAWAVDYATTYRHQILSVYGRIAELCETDHPDQAVAALEEAIEYDPVNEELYQRLIRIHGRQGRPDVVRRTLRRLEDRLDEIGHVEVSEATRRVAARQLSE